MRVDLVITELPVGGAERCLTELAVGLDQRGFRVRVLSIGPPPPPPRDALVQRLHAAAIPFHSLHASSAGAPAAASAGAAPMALYRLRKLLRADRPDVVQTFLHHANVLGTLAARLAKVPTCIGGIRVAQPSRWRSFLERRAIARMDAVVCVSDAVEAFARQHLVPPGIPTTVIANGVDLDRFSNAVPTDWTRWGIPDDARVAIFIGRLEPQKGLEQLFAAAETFLRDDENHWLVLAGDGPQRSWAEAACQGLPGKRAKCIGWQPDVAPLLAAARLLVLTSRYEGMPNAVLEAMASARPVVCFAVEGIEQIFTSPTSHVRPVSSELRHPDTLSDSFIARRLAAESQQIPVGSTQEFARAVSRFLGDDHLQECVGRENRACVAERFTINAMVDAYAALYETAVRQRAAGERFSR